METLASTYNHILEILRYHKSFLSCSEYNDWHLQSRWRGKHNLFKFKQLFKQACIHVIILSQGKTLDANKYATKKTIAQGMLVRDENNYRYLI